MKEITILWASLAWATQSHADGAAQLAWTLGATVGSTEILKSQVSELRPW